MLLTACIAPKQGIREHLRRSDPKVREEDYAAALDFWLEVEEPRLRGVVFAENSGHDLTGLRDRVSRHSRKSRPVEFISRDYPAPPLTLSYGHPEFLLVNDALQSSTLLAGERYFIKATGRYRFPRIDRLLRQLPTGFRVAVDARGAGLPFKRADPLVNAALAIFERAFYLRELAGLPEQMVPAPPWNRKQFIEHLLFDALYPRRNEPGIMMRWPCNCEPVGVGANGHSYTSAAQRFRGLLRAVGRRVLPRLWI